MSANFMVPDLGPPPDQILDPHLKIPTDKKPAVQIAAIFKTKGLPQNLSDLPEVM